MECDLVIEASPLFFLKSNAEEKHYLNDAQKAPNSTQAQGSWSPDVLENSVFPQDFFPAETSFLTIGSINYDQEGSALNQSLDTERNSSTKQESTRILDMIKYSPKFLRKKYAKQPCKNVPVSPSAELESNESLQDLNCKESLENIGSLSPKLGFRKKFQQMTLNSKDASATTTKAIATSTGRSKSPTPPAGQESSEVGGVSKGKKNWRKVKAALKRMNDGGEQLRSSLPSNEDNSQGIAKIQISSELSILSHVENEEDIYQRLKAFMNTSEKKPAKTPRSPRLQLRGRFSFWPKGHDSTCGVPEMTTSVEEENEGENNFNLPLSNQFSLLKARMYPLGIRRSSAPESVLRREAEAFSFSKKASRDIRMNSQTKAIKQVKANISNHREQEIKQKMRLIVKENLENLTDYRTDVCNQLSSTISEQVNKYLHSTEVSNEDEQKKFICLVYIGAVKDYGVYAAVRCLWSPGEDRLVVADYQSNSLYAVASVFIASC